MNFNDVLALAEQNTEILSKEFLNWLPHNEHVWRAFVHEAVRVRAVGFKHYSARTIIHFLRHHTNVSEKNSLWKINDHHSPYMARLYDLCYPEHAGLWSFRETCKARYLSDDEIFDL